MATDIRNDIVLNEDKYTELCILLAHDTWHDFYGNSGQQIKSMARGWSFNRDQIHSMDLDGGMGDVRGVRKRQRDLGRELWRSSKKGDRRTKGIRPIPEKYKRPMEKIQPRQKRSMKKIQSHQQTPIQLLEEYGNLLTREQIAFIVNIANKDQIISNDIINHLYNDYQENLTLYSFMFEKPWPQDESYQGAQPQSMDIEGGALSEEIIGSKVNTLIECIERWDIFEKKMKEAELPPHSPPIRINGDKLLSYIKVINDAINAGGYPKNNCFYTFFEYVSETKDDPLWPWSEEIKGYLEDPSTFDERAYTYIRSGNPTDLLLFYHYTSQMNNLGGEIQHVISFTIDPAIFISYQWPGIISSLTDEIKGHWDIIKKYLEKNEYIFFWVWKDIKNYVDFFFGILGRWWIEFIGYDKLSRGSGASEWAKSEANSLLSCILHWDKDNNDPSRVPVRLSRTRKGLKVTDDNLVTKFRSEELDKGGEMSHRGNLLELGTMASLPGAAERPAPSIVYYYNMNPGDLSRLKVQNSNNYFIKTAEKAYDTKSIIYNAANITNIVSNPRRSEDKRWGILLPGSGSGMGGNSHNCTPPSVIDAQPVCTIADIGSEDINVSVKVGEEERIQLRVNKSGVGPEDDLTADKFIINFFLKMRDTPDDKYIEVNNLRGTNQDGEKSLERLSILKRLLNKIREETATAQPVTKIDSLREWRDQWLRKLDTDKLFDINEPFRDILQPELLNIVNILIGKTIGDFGQELYSVSLSKTQESIFLSGDKPSTLRYWFMQKYDINPSTKNWWGGFLTAPKDRGTALPIQIMCHFKEDEEEERGAKKQKIEPDTSAPFVQSAGGKKKKKKKKTKRKKTIKKKKEKTKLKIQDLPSEIQKLFENRIVWDSKGPKINYENCKKLQKYCEINPRKCYLEKEFLNEFVRPCQKLKKEKLNEKKNREKTEKLILSFLQNIPLGNEEDMIEAIEKNTGIDTTTEELWYDYLYEIGLPDEVNKIMDELIAEYEFDMDENGEDNTWISFLLKLRGYHPFSDMEDSLNKKNADLIINLFLHSFEDRLKGHEYTLEEIEGFKQTFLKEIQ